MTYVLYTNSKLLNAPRVPDAADLAEVVLYMLGQPGNYLPHVLHLTSITLLLCHLGEL